MRQFDAAREAFKSGNYDEALKGVNAAIQQLPSDAVLHEFRALVLFAQGQYDEAAGTIYAVLAAGPGWDWETLKTLYPDTATYTQQLRSLEQYAKEHPDAGSANFLLAYHYLVLNHREAAVKQLDQVVKKVPGDNLAAQLLSVLKRPESGGGLPS